MPSDPPPINLEELMGRLQKQSEQQNMFIDPFTPHGMPLHPDKVDWWAEGAEDAEKNSHCLLYLMSANSLTRLWLDRESVDKFIAFMENIREHMGPIQPAPKGLYVPKP
jgi:hypothetical protein